MADYNRNIKINLDYSNFSGGITDCNRKMQLLTEQFKLQKAEMGNSASKVDELSLQESMLTQQINLQQQIVMKSVEKWDALAQSEDASLAQTERAHKQYLKQATTLEELKNKLDGVRQELDKAGDSEDEYTNKSEQSGAATQNFGQSVMQTISTVTSFVAVIKGVGDALSDMASKTTGYADDLLTMSSVTSLSTDTLQELQYASDFVDVSLETMTGSMTKMIRQMGEAANGSASASEKFDQLGVSIYDSTGNLKSSEQMFFELIDVLGQVDNATERDAASMAIFGRSAQELNPLIDAGSAQLEQYAEEAQRCGYVVGEESLKQWGSAQDAIDEFTRRMEAGERTLAGVFTPAIEGALGAVNKLPTPVLGLVGAFGSLISIVSTLSPLIQLLTTAKMASTTATIAATAAESAKASVDVVATGTTLALNAAMAPEILLIGALIAIIAAIVIMLAKFNENVDELSKSVDLGTTKLEKFFNILRAGAGDYDVNVNTNTQSATKYMASGSTAGGAGGLTWVGEQGAELVNLPYGSTVYNHEESRKMSSTSNYFNVTIDAKSVDDFNKVCHVFSGLEQSFNRGGKVNG